MANYEHVRKLLEGTESWNASVEEQRAEDSNWRADLRGVNLARTDLIGANLTGAYLTGADLTDADLRRADLRRADLRRAMLIRADLTHAILSHAILEDAHVEGANLAIALVTPDQLSRTKGTPKRALQGSAAPIERSIEFPPELMGAGTTMLHNFAKHLKHQYSDIEAAFRITQNGNNVTLEVETADGNVDRIERSLEEYGRVVLGELEPEEYLSEPKHAAELRSDLRLMAVQVQNARDFHELQASTIKGQARTIEALQGLLGSALAGNQTTADLIHKLVDRIANGADPAVELAAAGSVLGASPSWDTQELVRTELEKVKREDTGKFREFASSVAASGVANQFPGLAELLSRLG